MTTTDTNNTDGAALLPVTPEDIRRAEDWAYMLNRMGGVYLDHSQRQGLASQFAAHRISHSLPGDVGMRWRPILRFGDMPLDGTWFAARCTAPGYSAVRIVHYADRRDRLPIDHSGWVWPSVPTEWVPLDEFAAALTPSPLPATQEDAERSGVGSVNCTCPQREKGSHHYTCANYVPRDAESQKKRSSFSTPQRQEYDGEAVREALAFIDKFFEPWGAWKTAWWEGEVSGDAAFSADNALKHVANILRRAALAHPAQATPSALSGDAGEGEHSELNADLCARITEYLCAGGLVNPELMDHKVVRDLLIDIREALRAEHRAALPSHKGAGE